MKNYKRLTLFFLVLFLGFLSGCQDNTQNDHLPEYCQTYAGFSDVASEDLYALLTDQGYNLNRYRYISVISEIELEFEVDDPNREIDLGGIQCFQNLTSLTLMGRSFKDISDIKALSNIQFLRLENTSVVSIDSFQNLSKIKTLEISNTKTLQSVTGVGEMTKLTDLNLSNNGLVNVGELNKLTNLKTLDLSYNEIKTFPSINNLVNLETLNISNNIIESYDDLTGLVSLRTLDASFNNICDLSDLSDLTSIRTLDLSNNNLGCVGEGLSPNFDSLLNSPNLTELYLNDNDLSSIEDLRNKSLNVKILHLENNRINDLTPIGNYTGIEQLYVENNNLTSIPVLSGMEGLTIIDLNHNNLTGFANLLDIDNLVVANLSFNQITTIPEMSDALPNLRSINLSENNLIDTSGFEGHQTLQEIILYNNGLSSLTDLSDLPSLIYLGINSPVVDGEVINNPENIIALIDNCFNNTPFLTFDSSGNFFFPFFVNDVILQINSSFTDIEDVERIDLDEFNLITISPDSFTFPDLVYLSVSNNSLSDVSFIMGNQALEVLNVSGNSINNLGVISGIDNTDLNRLRIVYAENINVGNALIGSFNDLPNLEGIHLLGTNITSIDNSFNELDDLITLEMNSTVVESISNSFNDLYPDYSESNVLAFTSGFIGTISNSFNGGYYHSLNISNQSPTIDETIIVDSFNDISIESEAGFYVVNNDFKEIDGSFNNIYATTLGLTGNFNETVNDSFNGITLITFDMFTTINLRPNATTTFKNSLLNSTINNGINLSGNQIIDVTGSFTGTTVTTLNLANNNLTDLPQLNTMAEVNFFDISGNDLSTVAFIDDIVGLVDIDISNQTNLTTLDGINNLTQVDRDSFNFDENNITSIDGFKNTSFTSLGFSKDNLTLGTITTISDSSFTGTDLEDLNFIGHELTSVNFLNNLPGLAHLELGLNMVDLSAFETLSLKDSLGDLVLSNSININDFAFLDGYALEELTILEGTTTQILNLDNLENLSYLDIMGNQILSVHSSFNNMPELIDGNGLDFSDFNLLLVIDDSFDIYEDEITIENDIIITNSFSNISIVTIEGSSTATSFNFDENSFTSAIDFYFDNAYYNDYSQFNTYTNLSTIIIEVLHNNITNLDNDSISLLAIQELDPGVDSIDANINGMIAIDATTSQVMSITGEYNSLQLYAEEMSFTVSPQNSTVSIDILSNDLIVTSNILETLAVTGEVTSLVVTGTIVETINTSRLDAPLVTLNTESLSTLTETNNARSTLLTINSLSESLNIQFYVEDVIINDDALATLVNNLRFGSSLTINTEAETLDVLTMDNIAIIYVNSNTLLSAVFSDFVTSIDLDAPLLNQLEANDSSIVGGSLSIHNNVETFNVLADNVQNLFVYNDAIENLILDNGPIVKTVPHLILNSNNTSPITVTGIYKSMQANLMAASVLKFGPGTEIQSSETARVAGDFIDTINANDAVFPNLEVVTQQTDFTITGSGISTYSFLRSINDDFNEIDDLTVSNNNATVNLTTSASTINLNTELDTLVLFGNNIDTIATSAGSNINLLDVTTTKSVVLQSTLAAFNNILIETTGATVTIDAVNAASTTINNALNINDITATIGGTITVNDSTVPTMTMNIVATDVILNLNASTVIFNSASDIETLTLNTPQLSLLDFQNATVVNGFIEGSNETLTIEGINVENIDISSIMTTLDLNISSVATVINNTGTSLLSVETSTSSIDVTSQSDVTITGPNLDDISFELSTHDVSLILNKDTLSATITGTANDVTISGTDIDDLMVINLTVSLLTLNNLDVNTLDLDTVSITTLDVVTTSPDYELVNAPSGLLFNVESNNDTFEVIGSIEGVVLNMINLETLTLTNAVIENLIINSDELQNLDTLNNVSNSVSITTTKNNFNLTTDAPTVNFISNNTYILNVTTEVDILNVSTNTDTLNITSTASTVNVTGPKLTFINGTASRLNVLETEAGTISININADNVRYTANQAQFVLFIGTQTIDEISIESNAMIFLDTNNVVINNLIIEGMSDQGSLSTSAETIEITTPGQESSVVYQGLNPLTLVSNDVDILNIVLQLANTLNISGTANIIEVSGGALNTLNTTGFTANNFTMNNTQVFDLAFLSTSLLNSVSTLEINTLEEANIASIISTLDSTSINLISPITLQDIYDYYYNQKHLELTNLEASNQTRYNTERTNWIQEAYDLIQLNSYMTHLDEITIKTAIDTQTYLTVEDYFQSYLTDIGQTEEDLGAPESANARNAITDTLNDPLLIVDETGLNTLVEDSIIEASNNYATLEQSNDTFTLNE